jgi:hypothetical protein
MSLEEYYRTFLSKDAPMNFFQYYKNVRKDKDVKLENYKQSEDG